MADEHYERLVRHIVQANDPLLGVPTPPPSVSAAQLRLTAQQRSGRVASARWADLRRHWPLWLIPVGAVVIVSAAAVIVGALPHRPEHNQASAGGAGTAPAPLALAFPDQAPAAREALQTLADQVGALPDPTPTGRYGHIHTQRWPDSERTPIAGQIVAVDEQLWTAPDHTAHQRVAPLPPEPAGRVLANWVDGAPGTGTPAQTHDYRPGQLSPLVDSPSTEPAVLAAQLSTYQAGTRTASSILNAVAQMNRFHVLSARQRAAALQVLADTDGLTYRGPVTDRAGRPGIAIGVDTAGNARDLAIFAPDTGALLSYERTVRDASPATVVSYLLYLSTGWTDKSG